MKPTIALAAVLALVSIGVPAYADDAPPHRAPGVESEETQVAELPREEAPPRVLKRRSTGMFASGIVLSSLGGLSIAIGAAVFAMQGSTDASLQSAQDACESANDALVSAGYPPNDCGMGPGDHDPWAGVAFLVGGAVGMAVGVPLAVVGGQKVPVTITTASITPVQGGAILGVRGTF